MKNSDYWINRFGQLESVTNKDAMEAYRDVEEIYQKAQTELEDKINTWYQRFATNNQISMAEARKLLTTGEMKELKWSVEEYIKHGKENSISGQWAKELENASARFHVSRLEALKLQTQQSIEALYGNQLDIVDSAMRKAYSQRYYRTAFEFQKGFGVGFAVDRLDENTLSKIINKPWAVDGYNFSKRIWTNKEKLIGELHSSLTRNIITGADPAKAIKEIKSKMGVSSNAAGRLIMTESAYFGSVAQKDMLNNLDVEKYEIVATLDSKTSEICRSLDGKVFDMKDYQAGVTAPPFHPYCRTTTAPYFDDWEELGVDRGRVARNDRGKNYFVDGDMSYKEWEKEFVKDDNKNNNDVTKPDFKIKAAKNSGVSKKGEIDATKMVLRAIEKLPIKVRTTLNDAVFELGYEGSSCDIANKIIYIGIGSEEEDVFHEMGHLVENYMMDSKKVKEYKESLVAGLGINDIMKVDYINNIGADVEIYVLRGKNFESEYQSRLYAPRPKDALNNDGSINTDLLGEVISEPFRKYMIGEPISDTAKKLIEGAVR